MAIRPTALAVAVLALTFAGHEGARAQETPFEGLRALVVQPENSWGWDSAVFGALEERGFDVTFGSIPDDLSSLLSYDLVALSIKRSLSPTEEKNLQQYVEQGGAVYGSWGGPFSTPGFFRQVCRAGAWKSLRRTGVSLLDSPLTAGIADVELAFAVNVGHLAAGQTGWEVVSVQPIEGGIPVAKDAEGNVLGVLSQYGKGRTVVLGFGPEKEKYFTQPRLGPLMVDNLLAWLLEPKLKPDRTAWPNLVRIALPARAEVTGVYVNEKQIDRPEITSAGSLRKINLDVSNCGQGSELRVRVTYRPLAKTRNVETIVHLPWNTLRLAAESPAKLAEYLQFLNVSICQPLLRGQFGEAWYKGMPEDKADDRLVKQYPGNFLNDLIAECHNRGIKVVGGVYLDNSAPMRKYPDIARLDKLGTPIKDRYGRLNVCFNDPRGQEHNLEIIKHLLANYRLDGVILDDNFELDKAECYCPYCKEGFRRYCEASGVPYQDPSQPSGPAAVQHWRQYRQEATRTLVARVREITNAHGVPLGGWVGVGMDATHLSQVLDWLGGMVYTEPPRSARGPLSVIGSKAFVCLLWAPNASPETIEREAREAVHAGCSVVGFWIRGDDGGYQMDAARSEAIARALGAVEQEWQRFYRENLVRGDPRFEILEASVGTEELTLRLRNTGRQVSRHPRRLDLGFTK